MSDYRNKDRDGKKKMSPPTLAPIASRGPGRGLDRVGGCTIIFAYNHKELCIREMYHGGERKLSLPLSPEVSEVENCG